MAEGGLYRLLTWLSPAYPTGAFSYSHGLEWAVEAGQVTTEAALIDWAAAIIAHGSGRIDASFLAAAYTAFADGDSPPPDAADLRGATYGTADENGDSPHLGVAVVAANARNGSGGGSYAFRAVAELAAAWAPTAELALETQAQGAAFLAATRAAWPHPALDRCVRLWPGPWALPVAVGAAAAAHGLALQPVMTGYLHAFAANLVSAGQRLIPLGQTAAQRAIAALEPVIAAVAPLPLDRLGAATPMVDLASMRHETQYTRLFRS